jgi:pregnancy-associated plasma protein-A
MKVVHAWVGAVVAVAVAAGLSAAPAGAAASVAPTATFCDPLMADPLMGDSLAAAARGAREPVLDQTHDDLPRSARGKAKASFQATVPVYFHVVTDGSTGNLTDAQIAGQIRVLNNTFGGGEGGADTGFRFQLAGVDRTNNANWFYGKPSGTDEKAMKRALHRGGPESLNLYTTDAAQYLGWAYLPDITTKPGQVYLDGVIIDWASVRGASTEYAGRYDQGETATHEVGHWLNLEHTFYGGCNANGDFVADTPAEKEPTAGCPAGKDTCPAPGEDPIHNYMDYSYDQCYLEFTEGQAQRMADSWLLYRAP